MPSPIRLPLVPPQNLEGENIESLKVPQVRSKLGLVSQEPVLFDRTLAENIMYGDNERSVSMDEVVEASKNSNIHNFISTLPLVNLGVYYCLENTCGQNSTVDAN